MDQAIDFKPKVDEYLQQGMKDVWPFDRCVSDLKQVLLGG
ncbi:MAG: hypothetical protein ACRC64_09405 [Plesiomonas shigelloides]